MHMKKIENNGKSAEAYTLKIIAEGTTHVDLAFQSHQVLRH